MKDDDMDRIFVPNNKNRKKRQDFNMYEILGEMIDAELFDKELKDDPTYENILKSLAERKAEIEEDDEDVDEFFEVEKHYMESPEKLKEEDAKYNFPILRSKALEIANRDENLKTDYCRNTSRGNISYICFTDKKIEVVEIENKKYWQIQILSGDVSGMEVNRKESYNWDGWLGDKDLNLLRCLVDVETGEYIYYPLLERQKSNLFSRFFKKFHNK